jgi:hypothetical protein
MQVLPKRQNMISRVKNIPCCKIARAFLKINYMPEIILCYRSKGISYILL